METKTITRKTVTENRREIELHADNLAIALSNGSMQMAEMGLLLPKDFDINQYHAQLAAYEGNKDQYLDTVGRAWEKYFQTIQPWQTGGDPATVQRIFNQKIEGALPGFEEEVMKPLTEAARTSQQTGKNLLQRLAEIAAQISKEKVPTEMEITGNVYIPDTFGGILRREKNPSLWKGPQRVVRLMENPEIHPKVQNYFSMLEGRPDLLLSTFAFFVNSEKKDICLDLYETVKREMEFQVEDFRKESVMW